MSYRLNTQVKPLIWTEALIEYHKGSRVEYMVKVSCSSNETLRLRGAHYSVSTNVKVLVLQAKAQFKRRSTANNVEIYVPVPDDADSPKFRVSALYPLRCRFWMVSGHANTPPDRLGIGRHGSLRSREICLRVEDQAIGWRSGIPDEGSLWSPFRQRRFVKAFAVTLQLAFLLADGFTFFSRSCFVFHSAEESDKRAPITCKFEIPYFTVSGIQVRYLKIVEKSGYQALPWVR